MTDGSELASGEYRILPTEEPRKYVIAVKLSTKVINHLTKGTHRNASICFGEENKFIVDNEQYTFTVSQQSEEKVQECYYQSGDIFAEIGGVEKKLIFNNQELTGEDRTRIKESSRQAEARLRNHQSIVLSTDGKPKSGTRGKGYQKTPKIRPLPQYNKPHRALVVPRPAARPTTPPPNPPRTSSTPSTQVATPIPTPTQSAHTPPTTQPTTPTQPTSTQTPPQPIMSPPQHPQPQQKVLSPQLPSSTTPSTPTTPTTPPAQPPVLSRSKPAPPPGRPPTAPRTRNPPSAPNVTPAREQQPSAPPVKVTLRMQLIHDLALLPRQVSKLAEKRGVTAAEVTQLLPSFAKYNPPGLWHPTDEMFREVDLDWSEYSPEDRESVREKVNEALAKLAANPPAPVEEKSKVDATKNLKDIITLNPSEKIKKRRRVDPSLPKNPPPPPAGNLSPPDPSPSLSPNPSQPQPKKRQREPVPPGGAHPNPAKMPKHNSATAPIPNELLSPPPSQTTPPHVPASAPTPPPAPVLTPTPVPHPKRKPPHAILKPPPSALTSPTPAAPATPPTVTTASALAPPAPTPAPTTTPTPTPTTPTSAPTATKAPPSSTSLTPPPLTPKPPPTFTVTISNNQDNEKYRQVYHKKYGTYCELNRKLNENRDLFLKFDQEWKHADAEARKALSVKIEVTYRDRRTEVERMQEEHGALHAELKAIKDAMRQYVDTVASSRNAPQGQARSRSQAKAQGGSAPSKPSQPNVKAPAKSSQQDPAAPRTQTRPQQQKPAQPPPDRQPQTGRPPQPKSSQPKPLPSQSKPAPTQPKPQKPQLKPQPKPQQKQKPLATL